jgi:uncharacterized protein (DUF1697 family)
MAKYVAFLRSINVGGHVLKMDKLRDLFVAMKFRGVETFIASGNVIFETKALADEALEKKIEKHLEASLGYEVGTFVRSVEEVRAISEYKPFSKDGLVVNVGMMRSAVKAAVAEEFNSEVDDFHIHGREVYWLCQIRTSESKFPAKKFEKAVGGVTWRNRNTMVRLAAKYSRERYTH